MTAGAKKAETALTVSILLTLTDPWGEVTLMHEIDCIATATTAMPKGKTSLNS